MRDDRVIIRRSNDRSNVHPVIEQMQYPANGWLDIDRILKLRTFMPEPLNELEGDAPQVRPPPFLVYVNSRKDSELLCVHQWNALPDHYLKEKIVWFHSGMSSRFRQNTVEDLKTGKIWGIFCTDAAGMVSLTE